MQAWNVYLNGKNIDTVFYNNDCEKDYVLDGLINHDCYDSAITVQRENPPPYKRKTEDEWQIQGFYPPYGWEEVTAETNRKDAIIQVKCYRENETNTAFRIVKKRIPITI